MENTKTQKKLLPPFLMLTLIAVIAAVVLAATNAVTKGPIQERKMAQLMEAFGSIMPDADDYEEITVSGDYNVDSLYAAKQNGEVIGYCVTASKTGYQSPVAVTMGVGTDGVVTKAVIGDSSFAETEGLGTRVRTESYQAQFEGLVVAEGGAIECLTGATVTSTAVLNASNAALKCVNEVALGNAAAEGDLLVFGVAEKKPAAAPVVTGNSASAKGFQSDVTVTATFDANGAVESIEIGSADETPGFGTRCAEDEAFLNQFIGKTAPFTAGENVDVLAGATVTSNAVIEALNQLASAPASAGAAVTGTAKGFQSDVTVTLTVDGGKIASIVIDSANETPGFGTRCAEDEAFLSQFVGQSSPVSVDVLAGATVTSNAVIEAVEAALASAPASAGVTVTGSAKGFQSDVNVTLTVEGGKIASIVIESGNETPGFGTRCAEDEAFLNQFVGQSSPVSVDVLAGATVTSNAVIEAVEAALASVPAEGEIPATVIAEGEDATLAVNANGAAIVTPVEGYNGEVTVTLTVENGAVTTGEFVAPAAEEVPAVEGEEKTASAEGFESNVVVTVTVDAEGKIAAIKVDSSNETPGFGTRCAEDEAFLNQFIGKTIPVEGVEVLTGATWTSNAVIEAVNKLAPAAEEAAVEGEEKTASAEGFESQVVVTVTVDAEGKIAAIKVDSSNETPGFGTRCAEDEAFLNQFIGKTIPVEGVEVLTGATWTSNAVIEAVNKLAPAQEEAAPAVEGEEKTASAKGFASDVTVTVTVDAEGKIVAIKVDSSNETPNFGTRCAEDEAYLNQFIGKTIPVEGVDALSGATVTSNAIVAAINTLTVAEEEAAPAVEGEEKTASAKGFASDVTVTVTVDAEGKIAAIKVDSSNETPNFGTRCAEDEAYLAQFIGKTIPVEGVDALSGATVTSNAIVAAINTLAVAEEEAAPAVEGEEKTASAKGFASDVTVTVTVDAEGKIVAIKVDSSNETPGFGTRCAEDEAYLNQFIGKTIPVEGVDALSGATVTSNAIVAAINTLAVAEEEAAPAGEEKTASAKGFASDVTVTVTVDAEGKIVAIKVDSSNETPNFGTRCAEDEAYLNQFIGKTIPVEGVDALSGATVTSNAIVSAINSLAQ